MRWPWTTKPKPIDTAALVKEAAVLASQQTAEAFTRAMWADSPAPGAPSANMGGQGWTKSPYPVYNNYNPWKYFSPIAPTRRPESQVSLEDLRLFADRYDVLRLVIQHLKREVFRIPIQFVPKDEKDQSSAAQVQIKEAEAFFSRRGGLGGFGRTRKSYEGMLIEDLLVIGSVAVWFQPNRALRPFQSVPFDAATIRPRVDAYGWPGPGDEYYEQWVMGLKVGTSFTPDQMYWGGLPANERSYSPYPASQVEWLLLTIMRGMQADAWNLSWLTDGNTPSDMVALPDTWTPDQVWDWSETWDAKYSGNTKGRQKTKWIPSGTTRIGNPGRKDQDFEQLNIDAARRTGAMFGVQLASVGFVGEQYKHTQEDSMDATSEFGVGEILEFRADHYEDVLDRLGLDLIKCKNVTEREEKALDRANRLKVLGGGIPVLTQNEMRAEEGRDPLENGDVAWVPTTLQPIEHALIEPPDPLEMLKAKSAFAPAGNGNNGSGGGKSKTSAKRAVLIQWRKKALLRVRQGKGAACEFITDDLPDEDNANISALLTRCETSEDVNSLFGLLERADDVEWITVNGRHIPIGADGEPTTAAGKEIVGKSDKGSGKEESSKPTATTKEDTPNASVKSLRAKLAHVMVDKEIQRYSEEHNETAAAKALGGVSLRDNEPVDILVIDAGKVKHGVELKTMVANTNNKITMKKEAQEKKTAWMQKNNADFHTVVFDDQNVFNANGAGKHDDSQRQIFYKRGFGSFRVNSMHQVKDMAELKSLMDTAADKLPAAAMPPKSYVAPGIAA